VLPGSYDGYCVVLFYLTYQGQGFTKRLFDDRDNYKVSDEELKEVSNSDYVRFLQCYLSALLLVFKGLFLIMVILPKLMCSVIHP